MSEMTSSAAGGPRAILPELKILWVHNSPKGVRMFLWDVRDALPAGIAVTELPVPLRPSPRRILRALRDVRNAAEGHDVVHAQFGSLVGFLAAFTSKPYVLSLRGTDFYVLPTRTLGAWLEARLRQLLTFVGCLRAHQIVVMSNRMRRELRRWPFLFRKPIVVMVDPIGEEFVEAAHVDVTRAGPFQVFVGSMEAVNAVKRTWIVEHAVMLCRRAGLPIGLTIVSGKPRAEVKAAMQASDLIALTSTHEGWPNIVKEGLACGLPLVATDVSDLKDHCGPDTLNRIVEPDSLDLALALTDALARRETGSLRAEILPGVVGTKHRLLYEHVTRGRK